MPLAVPVGAAFLLRSARAEQWAGYVVVLAIFVSACVALWQAVERLLHPQELEYLLAARRCRCARLYRKRGSPPRYGSGGPPSLERRLSRRWPPRPGRRFRLARRRPQCDPRRARGDTRRPDRRARHHACDPEDHLASLANHSRRQALIGTRRVNRGRSEFRGHLGRAPARGHATTWRRSCPRWPYRTCVSRRAVQSASRQKAGMRRRGTGTVEAGGGRLHPPRFSKTFDLSVKG